MPKQFVAAVAEQALDLAVDQDDVAESVDQDHAARAGFDGQLEFLLGKLLRRYVACDVEKPDDFAGGTPDRSDA